jgi:UDP-perosamine 4-acetyltransferase
MNIVIVGAGGHGKVVLDTLELAGKYKIVGFIDADSDRVGTEVNGIPILGPINMLDKLRRQNVAGAIVAIGDNRVRRSYAEAVLQSKLELVTAIHPTAVISRSATIGRNILIAAGAILNAETQVADSAIINTGAIIEHECRIGQAAHICPGAVLAGRVQIGEGAFVGLGAKIIPCMTVGVNAIVGAGAVVVEDVPADTTVTGVPAKVIKSGS